MSRRLLGLCGVLGAAALAGGTVASSASAATWSLQTTPKVEGVGWSYLANLSCTSLLACTAVGSDGWPRVPLVERWNGAEWALETPASTTDAWSELDSVSCVSATACMAVGGGGSEEAPAPPGPPASHDVPLAEQWNGTAWTTTAVPSPTDGGLNSVSCTSATACIAIGGGGSTIESGPAMVAEHWNGTAWTMETIPSPPGEASALYSISCTAATACTAVGLEASEGLVERWNGIAWSRQALPALKEGEERRLESVSCVSATSCMAVGVKVETHKPGETFPPPPNSAVAESWNGTTWTQEEPAIPVAVPSEIGHESYFYGVSCTSATACTATGRFVRQLEESPPAKRAEDVSLAEEWNGTTWTAAETPNPAGGVNESLIGVSCVAEAECLSVGEFGNTTEKSREALAEVDPPEAELAEIKRARKSRR